MCALAGTLLALVGVFAYWIAAYIWVYKLHHQVTGEAEIVFLGLFLADVVCLILGAFLLAQLPIKASTVRRG